MYKTIKDGIAAVLTSITGDGLPLKASYAYHEVSPQSYPCAMVFAKDGQEIRLDSASNEVTAQYVVRVLIREKNTLAGEDQRLDLMDAVPAAFRTHSLIDTLGGLCQKFDIGNMETINLDETEPVFGFDLNLVASKIVLIS